MDKWFGAGIAAGSAGDVGITASCGGFYDGRDSVRTRCGDLGDGGSAWGGMCRFRRMLAFGDCTNRTHGSGADCQR